MTKVSIIIPVYNVSKEYLRECLESCLSSDTEVIVVDDGSSINYSDILKEYDIKYLKIKNSGCGEARNKGMEIAKGKYYFFLDADDKLKDFDKILDDINNEDIILLKSYILNKEIPTSNKLTNGLVDKDSLKRDMFILEDRNYDIPETVWAKFYKKDFITKNGIKFNSNLRRGEDVLFNYEAYSNAESIYYIDEYVYQYRVNNDSVTRSFDHIMDITTYKLLEEFEKLFKKLNINDPNYPNYVFRLIVRLIRKYYCYLSYEEFNSKIDMLFSNVILDYYLKIIDISNMDIYKKRLYNLLLMKDRKELYSYIEDVVSKKLLKK